jgi:hypothetical protein
MYLLGMQAAGHGPDAVRWATDRLAANATPANLKAAIETQLTLLRERMRQPDRQPPAKDRTTAPDDARRL